MWVQIRGSVWAPPRKRDTQTESLRRRGRGDRCSIIDADAAEARQLDGRVAQVETCDQAQKVDFDTLDPTELHPPEGPQRASAAGAAIGQADIGIGAEILTHRVRRQCGLEWGHRA